MVEAVKKEEVFEIPIGKYLNQVREDPWMIASVVLGFLFFGSLIFGFSSGTNVASQTEVGDKVLVFLNSQVNGEVTLDSITQKSGYYEIVVEYQGDKIPVYTTLDGSNLITDLVPVDGSSIGNSVGNTGNTGVSGARVDVKIPADAHIEGNTNAPVTIVEFSDFECPYCGKFYSESLGLIRANYIDTGKANFVFMHFPLGFHPDAMPTAVASECAGDQGKFWEMHDKIFEGQSSLGKDNYLEWAGELGLNVDIFSACLISGKHDAKINSDSAYGSSIGISGTPGFFINGVKVEGALPYSSFQQIIESELK